MAEHTGINGQELLEYLGGFNNDAYRKETLEKIVSTKIYERFLSTAEGKKVSEFFTRRISEDVANIIQIALAWDADVQQRTEKIILLGTRAGVALAAMRDMASQMVEGEKHINAMKEKEK